MSYKIRKDIKKEIFRAYDIRGIVPDDIDEDVAYTIGLSFGSYISLKNNKECILAHDNRISSKKIYKALLKGIKTTGINIISLGEVTTPMYYYASIVKKISCGIMVTASHNPKEYNGFKIAFDKTGNARGKMIDDFYYFTSKYKFKFGLGKVKKYNILPEYMKLLNNSVNIKKNHLKVIIDTGNGTTSIFAKEIFKKYLDNFKIICGKSDGNFPNHTPDPTILENMRMLRSEVLEQKADLGIALDGDGDRLGIVDENGEILPIDKYMIIIIRDIINKVDNKTFLYDVKCSNSLKDEIIKLGGKPFEYRTGNSYTKYKTQEMDLSFGGEFSGHVFFRDRFPGFDSGIYAALRLIEIMVKENKNVTELLRGINKYFSTNEILIPVKENKKDEIISKVKLYSKEKQYTISTIDGIKIIFNDGWALIRKSNTTPNITLRFEAKTGNRLEELKKEFIDLIKKYNK